MPTLPIRDKIVLESFFRTNTELNIYSLGDLDDFFWPDTTWYALTEDKTPLAIALLYTGQKLPALLALSESPSLMSELLQSIIHLLPQQFYAHLSPGLESVFAKPYKLDSYGMHFKMARHNKSAVDTFDCSHVIRLSVSDMDDVEELYKASYPDNWFDRRMLETNYYFGLKQNKELVSIAGVHVYSATYRVAALGNITTHPSYRNNGFGTMVTARLCQELSGIVDTIGLNVKADNPTAISCYQKLGFEIIASYNEYMITRK